MQGWRRGTVGRTDTWVLLVQVEPLEAQPEHVPNPVWQRREQQSSSWRQTAPTRPQPSAPQRRLALQWPAQQSRSLAQGEAAGRHVLHFASLQVPSQHGCVAEQGAPSSRQVTHWTEEG